MTILETIENYDTLLSVETLSKVSGIPRKTLYKAITAGHLPAYHVGGIRLEPFAVGHWLRQRSTGK